jgi:4-hydroxy-tetrahydrodipicolinate synthase
MNALFVETNPIPVKYAVHLLGYCENELRLPLVELSEKGIKAVEEAMKASGVL